MVSDFEGHHKWLEFVLLVKMLFKNGWMECVLVKTVCVYWCILPNHVAVCGYFCVLHASPFDLINRKFSVFVERSVCIYI